MTRIRGAAGGQRPGEAAIIQAWGGTGTFLEGNLQKWGAEEKSSEEAILRLSKGTILYWCSRLLRGLPR